MAKKVSTKKQIKVAQPSRFKLKSLRLSPRKNSWVTVGAFVLVFAVIGAYFVYTSFAATTRTVGASAKNCSDGTKCYFWAHIQTFMADEAFNYRYYTKGIRNNINLSSGCTYNAAEDWSKILAAKQTLFHSDNSLLDSHCPGTYHTYVGEVLASAYAPRCDNADTVGCAKDWVALWINSPPHNAIMLDPRVNTIGMGLTYGPGGVYYAVGEFVQF